MTSLQRLTTQLDKSILDKLPKKESEIVVLAQSKKFSEYTNEDKQDLAKKLVSLSYFVGIKESPSIDTLVLLVRFICTKFPQFSGEELENAFYQVCAGELGDIDHYQNFSPIYLGKIINAYEEEKMKARRNYMQLQQKKEWEEQEKKRSEYLQVNALEIIAQQLKDEYLSWKEKSYANLTDLKKYSLQVLLEYAQTKNLFVKFDADNYTHSQYFEKYFLSLPDNKDEALISIDNYVRSYGKNILN
jgi:hypothetical protein